MKYLKLFETEAQYESFKSSEDYIFPNVSYCDDSSIVYYNTFDAPTSSYVAVDLGLPSGIKWANMNVGATTPEDPGLYFQWGDTVGYTKDQIGVDKVFDWNNYFDTTNGGDTFKKYAANKLTVLEPSDDAASVNMGSDWRMPTQADMDELIDNTTPIYIDLQGNEFSQSEAEDNAIAEYNLKGVKFIGSNGNSIFIPASGFCYDSSLHNVGILGDIWSSNFNLYNARNAIALYFNHNGRLYLDNRDRYFGMAIRAVK